MKHDILITISYFLYNILSANLTSPKNLNLKFHISVKKIIQF